MNEKSVALAEALVDVRRAYRLLHAYHRRLCDLLQATDELLSERGLQFAEWCPLNVAMLHKKKPFFRPEHWAWDLTPAYQVGCIWQGVKNGGAYQVRIEAVADTVYSTSRDGEPDPGRFKPAESSTSELWVGLWKAQAAEHNWAEAWKQVERTGDPFDGKEHTANVDDVAHTYRYFMIDLTELVDERAVKERLLVPLGGWLGA
jgi:uncharacterized protein YjiS (DUF1127 family)